MEITPPSLTAREVCGFKKEVKKKKTKNTTVFRAVFDLDRNTREGLDLSFTKLLSKLHNQLRD